MAINFMDDETLFMPKAGTERSTLRPPEGAAEPKSLTTSKDVSGIEIRMMAPYIKDNRTAKVFPFPGYAKLYCLTIVMSDEQNQLAGLLDLKGFPRIDDKEHLPINKTIYYWQTKDESIAAPSQIHIMCSVIKSKQSLREVAKVMTEVKNDEEYKGIMSSLGSLANNAAKFNVITDMMTQIAGLVGKYLGDVEDKPLGTVINSYTSLSGDFDTVGIQSLAYPTKYVDFNFKLVVRSKANENELAGNVNNRELEVQDPASAGDSASVASGEKVAVNMQPLN
ncbi:hypothetical protein OCK74_23065 [Chitinophagaceae bacterium LB-8]|uniref:Uncharacterized protein n=1 Tax=Paraflavisolibacter caeni TaxID=2982496 RepID=A0A9X3B9H9_9BACT|nr:hypothetical protein [Paraflavisolibacter caeni]MCU7552020.1 hypothetical protein [Paraflavisolibacter caeni]